MRIFLIPLSITFSNPGTFGFLVFSLTLAVKWEKLNFRKSQEFARQASRILHEWNDHLEIFSRSQVIQNSRQYLLLRTDILQKTLVGSPWINSVFCNSAKCGVFIQASLFKPGFELLQTVDFKRGVTFCDNSICVLPINHRKSQTPF